MNRREAERAISELFGLYRNGIFQYARLMLGSHVDAKDVVQEVFVRAFCAWDEFRHDSNSGTWMISLARNYIYYLLRKKKRKKGYLNTYQPRLMQDTSESVETRMVLEQGLAQLKAPYREILILRHISIQETARMLKCSEGRVRTMDYRALKRLREIMAVATLEVNTNNGR